MPSETTLPRHTRVVRSHYVCPEHTRVLTHTTSRGVDTTARRGSHPLGPYRVTGPTARPSVPRVPLTHAARRPHSPAGAAPSAVAATRRPATLVAADRRVTAARLPATGRRPNAVPVQPEQPCPPRANLPPAWWPIGVLRRPRVSHVSPTLLPPLRPSSAAHSHSSRATALVRAAPDAARLAAPFKRRDQASRPRAEATAATPLLLLLPPPRHGAAALARTAPAAARLTAHSCRTTLSSLEPARPRAEANAATAAAAQRSGGARAHSP